MADLDFHPAIIGADTTDLQSSDSSPILDAVTKGLPAAAISGAMSIYNTFESYAGKEATEAAATIRRYDQNWGNYYDDHKEGADVVGFLATSLIPGTLGMKALKLAQGGEALGAISRGLGYAASRKNHYLDEALRELGRSGGSINAQVSAAKFAQLRWATADNVLQSTAFELGVLATMHQSPIFEGDDMWDFAKNVAIGAAFGGVIGGALEHFAARGVLKKASAQIQGNRRDFDAIYNPERLGMMKGNELLAFAENMVNTTDDFYNTTFKFRRPGSSEPSTFVISTEDAFKAAGERAQKSALNEMALKFNTLAEGNEHVGQQYFKFIADKIVAGRAAGRQPADIADEIGGYLQNVRRIRSIDPAEQGAEQTRAFFVNKEPKGITNIFTEVRSKTTTKQAYYLAGDSASNLKITSVESIEVGNAGMLQAFKDGADMVMTSEGRVAVNPASKAIRKGEDEALRKTFFVDVKKGNLQTDPIVTAADTMRRADDATFRADEAFIGGKKYAQAETAASKISDKALRTSARFMWAGKLAATHFSGKTVDVKDFAVMERLLQRPLTAVQQEKVTLKLADGTTEKLSEIVDLRRLVQQEKLSQLEQQLAAQQKGFDTRQIASALGVEQQWVESAIARGFAPDKELLNTFAKLDDYYQPKNVAVEFDTSLPQVMEFMGPRGPNHMATVVMTHQYQLHTRLRVQENAAGAVLGADAARFPDAITGLAKETGESGAGATTFGASNASYGQRAELFVQEVGKQVSLVSQKWRDAAVEFISPQINKIRDNPEAAAELGVLTTALRRDVAKYHMVTETLDDGTLSYRAVDREALKLVEKEEAESIDDAIEYLQTQGKRGSYDIKNAGVGEFLAASGQLNASRLQKMTPLHNAAGLSRTFDTAAIYVPPVDTRRYPFHAIVRAKTRIGSESQVTMITAKDEAQLRSLAAKVPEDFEVIYKSDTDNYFKAKGQYDYDLAINESKVNSELARRGVLSDFFPETRAQNVLEDYVRWHATQEENVVRRAAEVKYRQFVSELDFLSNQYKLASTSVAKGKFAMLEKRIADPFGDYKKTMLNLSKQSEYPLLDSLNEFVDRIGKNIYERVEPMMNNPSKGLIPYGEVNKLMKEAGLGSPYQGVEEYLVANAKYPKNAISMTFQKVNAALATTVLRLDFINPLINAISTPIMLGTEMASIKNLIKNDALLVGQLAELTSVRLPDGSMNRIPSTTKLLGNAITNFFGENKAALLERYITNGDIKTDMRKYFEALDDMAYQEHIAPNRLMERMQAGVEKMATLTGSNFSEQITRFVTADVMRQLSDPLVVAGKMDIKTQNSYISSFVNRVQGNYISSQRPVVFQGTTGAAVGLFQTYAFNVLQQLLRHVENRDQKALWTFAGLQSTVYGFNGLPFFDAINTHLIGGLAAGNPTHQDAYTTLPNFNKELGDWMLYGTASAFPLFGEKAPALYSRGDINPRHLTILPINPLDIPAVSASVKLAQSLLNFGKNVAQGADISQSMLQALEHHGWNRPLAGFAQTIAGQSTTGKGSLISAANDLETTSWLASAQDRMVDFGGATRMLGAKPMNEAVALNQYYRQKSYEAADRAKIESLGKAVKTKLYNNQSPTDEEMENFMDSYATRGGRIETFSSSLQRWSKDANTSVVNQMRDKVRSPYGRNMQTLMGGEELEDYNE